MDRCICSAKVQEGC